jgi:hypothetical protein
MAETANRFLFRHPDGKVGKNHRFTFENCLSSAGNRQENGNQQ